MISAFELAVVYARCRTALACLAHHVTVGDHAFDLLAEIGNVSAQLLAFLLRGPAI